MATVAPTEGAFAGLARKWQESCLKQVAQSDPALAERIAMQAMPRPAEIASRRSARMTSLSSLETRVAELLKQAGEAKDPEEHNSILFRLSEHRRELAMVNQELGELDALERGAARRAELEHRRSEACRCVGVGGLGRIITVVDGVPLMERACDACPEGKTFRAAMDRINARLDDEEAREQRAKEEEARAARAAQRLQESGIPDLYLGSTLKTVALMPVETTREFRKMLSGINTHFKAPWVRGQCPKGVFLYGPAGHGKTSILAALAQRFIEWDFPVMFTTVLDLLDSLRAGYSRNDGSSDALLERAKTSYVLFVDDMGMQQGTDHERARLLAIITERHGRGKSLLTCYSSNYTMHETAVRIAGGPQAHAEEVARIERRLREMSDEVLIENLDISVSDNRRATNGNHAE